METTILDKTIETVKAFAASKAPRSGKLLSEDVWPEPGGPNIVIGNDVGMELGDSKSASFSGLIWTMRRDLIISDKITHIGPDIGESQATNLPYGKVVMVFVEGFDQENAYSRYRMMDEIRYRINLEGFMMRATSLSLREWCRLSKDAVRKGFSMDILGSELIHGLKKLSFVQGVEILFVTSNSRDVMEVQQLFDPVFRVISAMHKMINEMDPDCDECDYNDVCGGANALKAAKTKMKRSDEKNE